MKLNFEVNDKNHPDPFIFEDNGTFYLYATAKEGVDAYTAKDPFGTWEYLGTVTPWEGCSDFWAPSVIRYGEKYYIYVSCMKGESFQFMHVAEADSPRGPFVNEKCLYDRFSIDSHAVETKEGLFLWFAQNSTIGNRIGTRVFVDCLLDPYTPANTPVEKIVPTFDEEIFTPSYSEDCRWHTIEGPFWFEKDGWQYVMYSGGCYEDDTYHIGYAAAKTEEGDLLRVDYQKYTEDGRFAPVMIKNEFEEGTGHHSVLYYKGEYYAVYHGRDYAKKEAPGYVEARTARICRLHVENGIITAERYADHL